MKLSYPNYISTLKKKKKSHSPRVIGFCPTLVTCSPVAWGGKRTERGYVGSLGGTFNGMRARCCSESQEGLIQPRGRPSLGGRRYHEERRVDGVIDLPVHNVQISAHKEVKGSEQPRVISSRWQDTGEESVSGLLLCMFL